MSYRSVINKHQHRCRKDEHAGYAHKHPSPLYDIEHLPCLCPAVELLLIETYAIEAVHYEPRDNEGRKHGDHDTQSQRYSEALYRSGASYA